MRSNSRPATVVLAALAAVAAVSLLASCSSDDAISPSETTTGIAPETTTTTTIDPGSTSVPEARAELPGLWLATSGGIVDETGEVWAKPRPGETLRSPLSDGVGGVVYLRCTGDTLPRVVEDQQLKGVSPLALGEADNLMAIGTYQDHRVLLTGWTDTTIVPSFEEDRSGLVARLIDMDTQQVTPLDGWYGWESGPSRRRRRERTVRVLRRGRVLHVVGHRRSERPAARARRRCPRPCCRWPSTPPVPASPGSNRCR
ncbi:MAG: hypothetical protein V9G12_12555 [Microthrixaceae bacterium]